MRDTLIIGIACLAAILLGGWLYFWSSDAQKAAAPSGAVSFSVLDQGTHSGSITERKNYRIKSKEDLDALWSLVYGTGGPVDAVDFDREEVLAVFDGTHTTGGYLVSVASVTDADGRRMVRIVHTAPGPSCITNQSITSPYVIVILPKSPLALAHEDENTTADCR